jgi:hypothetical protein
MEYNADGWINPEQPWAIFVPIPANIESKILNPMPYSTSVDSRWYLKRSKYIDLLKFLKTAVPEVKFKHYVGLVPPSPYEILERIHFNVGDYLEWSFISLGNTRRNSRDVENKPIFVVRKGDPAFEGRYQKIANAINFWLSKEKRKILKNLQSLKTATRNNTPAAWYYGTPNLPPNFLINQQIAQVKEELSRPVGLSVPGVGGRRRKTRKVRKSRRNYRN